MFGKLIDSWNEEDIFELQANIVTSFLEKDTTQSVETSIEFAKFLHYRGLSIRNYPLFLEILPHKSEEVIDELIGSYTALTMFHKIQRNVGLVGACFDMLQRLTVNSYQKVLEAVLGVFLTTYRHPLEGWELYPPSLAELNQLGKYLDKNKSQSNKINRIVLDILGSIGELSLQEHGREEIARVGAHANKIRNVYFDSRERMDKVIPAALA